MHPMEHPKKKKGKYNQRLTSGKKEILHHMQAPFFFFWVSSFIVCGRARRILFCISVEMLDLQTRLVPFYLTKFGSFLFNNP
jgi:hypothetical protein